VQRFERSVVIELIAAVNRSARLGKDFDDEFWIMESRLAEIARISFVACHYHVGVTPAEFRYDRDVGSKDAARPSAQTRVEQTEHVAGKRSVPFRAAGKRIDAPVRVLVFAAWRASQAMKAASVKSCGCAVIVALIRATSSRFPDDVASSPAYCVPT